MRLSLKCQNLKVFILFVLLTFVTIARAENQSIETPPANDTPPVTKPAPYSLPWQLRSVIPGNVVRFDSANSFYKDKNNKSGGFISASVLGASYKLLPELALLARIGVVENNPPSNSGAAASVTNPIFGGIYSKEFLDKFRLAFFLGATLPIGSGGGNSPNPSIKAANSAGVLARSAMDNALFAVNYFTVIPGIDFAYISNGLTLQLEATLLQLTRTRGESADKDSTRTNFTSGFVAAYAFKQNFSLIGELRYQRWLKNDTVFHSANPAKDNLSMALGPRFNFKMEHFTFKPGLSYAQGLSGPMSSTHYNSTTNSHRVVFVDLPFVF